MDKKREALKLSANELATAAAAAAPSVCLSLIHSFPALANDNPLYHTGAMQTSITGFLPP